MRWSWWCEPLSHLLLVVDTVSACPHCVIALCVRRRRCSQTCAAVSWVVSLNGSLITEWRWLALLDLNSVWFQWMKYKKGVLRSILCITLGLMKSDSTLTESKTKTTPNIQQSSQKSFINTNSFFWFFSSASRLTLTLTLRRAEQTPCCAAQRGCKDRREQLTEHVSKSAYSGISSVCVWMFGTMQFFTLCTNTA